MANSLASDLANCNRGLVVAPAGCGKTHLISDAVQYCQGRQLVLTHTHAGIKAIRDRMARFRVPRDLYTVCTLDSFALKYAAAYPTLSAWTIKEPSGDEWEFLQPAAARILGEKFVEAVLRASYTGVFVDEYQDCSLEQHEIILKLASVLPCRILGDPLQSVFWEVNKGRMLPWKQVEDSFTLVGSLKDPHRWKERNEDLGQWLLDIRPDLLAGNQIDLTRVPGLKLYQNDRTAPDQLEACRRFMKLEGESLVAFRKWRPNCHYIAGRLNNAFVVFEDAHCQDLLDWTRRLDKSEGTARVRLICKFAEKWLVRLPKNSIQAAVETVTNHKSSRAHRADLKRLIEVLTEVRESPDWGKLIPVLDAFEGLNEGPKFKSREVWFGLKNAAKSASPSSNKSLYEAAWHHRDVLRRSGRQPARRCLATPLLVKGLEFDHALILDLTDFQDAESLYVCLSRASRSLTILSPSSTVRTNPARCL